MMPASSGLGGVVVCGAGSDDDDGFELPLRRWGIA